MLFLVDDEVLDPSLEVLPRPDECLAFYINYKDNKYSFIGIQDDVCTIGIISKVLQAAIAGISIYIVKSSL
jgi:hypothetical protein